ncbi:MAG: PorT family protein [Bacteroidales bacterium]|nr:PorT family protein [Bacteroidales bacterium]
MKRLLILILTCLPLVVFSQKQKPKNDPAYDKKPLHFGFTIGLNTMDFTVYHSGEYLKDSLYADVSQLRPGFNINIVSNLKLTKYFDLRFLPGISFGQRNLLYNKDKILVDDGIQKLESSFLEFPLLVKYKSKRINNFRPFLIGGGNYRIDLAARKDYDETENRYVRLKRSDLYYEIGFGIDFYLKYFKFTTELKLAVGLRDVLVHDPASGHPEFVRAIDILKSNLLILSFHFE